MGIWPSGVPNAVGGPLAPGSVRLTIVHWARVPGEVFGLNPGHGFPVFVDVSPCVRAELPVAPGPTAANTPRAGTGAAWWVTVLVPPPAGFTAADLTATAPHPATASAPTRAATAGKATQLSSLRQLIGGRGSAR